MNDTDKDDVFAGLLPVINAATKKSDLLFLILLKKS